MTDQAKDDITIRVSRSVNEGLELAKDLGFSKKDFLEKAVRWFIYTNNFANNDYDRKTSDSIQNDVMKLKSLERACEEQVDKGATQAELVAFKEVIENTRNRLKLYRNHNGDGGDV